MKQIWPLLLLLLAGVVGSRWVRTDNSPVQNDRTAPHTATASDERADLSKTPQADFRDFLFLDEHHGWAVTSYALWKTDDGGQTWEEIKKSQLRKLFDKIETLDVFEMLQFFDGTEGWVVEGNHLSHTTDGGVSWQDQEFEHVTVRSVRFIDRNRGWFAGQLMTLPRKKGDVEHWHPIIYETEDGGKKWRCSFIGPEDHYPLWDIWPISSTSIWAVGGLIVNSSDGGATWRKVKVSDWSGVGGMPFRVRFLDSRTGWIITNAPGAYLMTSDGGKTWEPLPTEPGTQGFTDVVYTSVAEAFGVRRALYHSTDHGQTWTKVADGDYYRVRYLREGDFIFAGGKGVIKRRRSP